VLRAGAGTLLRALSWGYALLLVLTASSGLWSELSFEFMVAFLLRAFFFATFVNWHSST